MTCQEAKRGYDPSQRPLPPGRGGYLHVFLNGKRSVLPMHGKANDLGKGLV